LHLTAQANRLTTGYPSERLIHNRALPEYAQPPINPIHEASAKADPAGTLAILQPLMSGQSTILIGQSGMGKSSLVNLLVPDAEIAVREISLRLDTGKHTTTFTRLYTLDEQSSVIDSPGFQEFGLYHLSEGMLERAFPEFEPHLGLCRFTNCLHVAEPDCAVLKAMSEGSIHPARHQPYLQFRQESLQKPYY
jgi:ribosome biogenesis GTPase